MLTNIAARSNPCTMLQVHTSSSRVLRPASPSLLKSRHQQQARAYRFGMWLSSFDPEFHRDFRRRHRMIKHKYIESLNHHLKWDRSPEDPRAILRRVVNRYMYPNHTLHGSPLTSSSGMSMKFEGTFDDDITGWKHEFESKAENYFTRNATQGDEFVAWGPGLNDRPNDSMKHSSKRPRRAKSAPNAESKREYHETTNTSQSEEYVIDPITNRKVLRKSYGPIQHNADALETSRTNASQHAGSTPSGLDSQPSQQPVYSNGPPPLEELSKYNDLEIEPETRAHSIAEQSEEYSLNHLPPEEAAEVREDVDKYTRVEYAQMESETQSRTQRYDDLDKYKPSEYDEVDPGSAEPVQKYDDLHEYKPYRYNESAVRETGSAPGYEDLHEYRPYIHDETSLENRSTQEYDDLDKYSNFEQDEKLQTTTQESLSRPLYEDLDKYGKFEHNEEVDTSNSKPKYEDLDKYERSEFLDEPQARASSQKYNDLNNYSEPYLHQEERTAAESNKYNDLHKYQPGDFNEDVPGEDQPFQQYGDLKKYRAYRFQDSEAEASSKSDTVDSCLKEYDGKTESWQSLDQSLSHHIAASNAADAEAIAHVKALRQRFRNGDGTKMTGNYVRDFPEEFSTTWNVSATGLKRESSGAAQEAEAKVQSAERKFSEDRSAATNATILETALDRQSKTSTAPPKQKKSDVDPYSSKPQGLETSYAEERSESSGPPFVRMYGSLAHSGTDSSAEAFSAVPLEDLVADMPSTESTTSTDAESTVYKILAYDPTEQNVSVAETTSVVPDQAKPLSPVQVLLRLSHPTKFFPHFAPLAAQGFEIVSGNGNVLVFRKARDVPDIPRNSSATPINPIDMMGKPAPRPSAATFASPTGFVNYDPPAAEERAPPFKSNIDVRREEPVFSGPKISHEGGKRHKKSVTKRVLVGGVWLAGLSYALGVIAEYFATGGVDGKGPTGF